MFSISSNAFMPNTRHHLRLSGNQRGLLICAGPGILVGETRYFAAFHDEDIVVPKSQVGINSDARGCDFLKALSLYLSSDFAFYHQFYLSPQYGIKRDVATLDALRALPVPFADFTPTLLKPWVELHSQLIKTSPIHTREARKESNKGQKSLFDSERSEQDHLLKKLNEMVYEALGLDEREQALVHDLVHVNLELNDGKVGQPAVRIPKVDELRAYASRLKKDLDAFVEGELDKRHQVGIIYDKASASGMIQVDLIKDPVAAKERIVLAADNPTAKQLEKTRQRLRKQHRQWIYFDRNLRIYEGTKTFILKPLQRFQWTESQAMQDATEIIAETLQLGGDGT